jgi:hypothetical protein
MAGESSKRSGIPWYSWIGLVAMLGVGYLIFSLTNSHVVTAWLRWGITILWIAITLGLGIYDFIAAKDSASRDDTPFDRWTISHGGAGIVFGLWYLPLVFVLILTIAWEFFEKFVPGFGDREIILNRVVDVGIATILWLVVVVITMLVSGSPFPLVEPYMH